MRNSWTRISGFQVNLRIMHILLYTGSLTNGGGGRSKDHPQSREKKERSSARKRLQTKTFSEWSFRAKKPPVTESCTLSVPLTMTFDSEPMSLAMSVPARSGKDGKFGDLSTEEMELFSFRLGRILNFICHPFQQVECHLPLRIRAIRNYSAGS